MAIQRSIGIEGREQAAAEGAAFFIIVQLFRNHDFMISEEK